MVFKKRNVDQRYFRSFLELFGESFSKVCENLAVYQRLTRVADIFFLLFSWF
jgi:hypothetical protein